ncbi:MAG: ParB/RepB/Spo0J family partition protein [Rhodobacteraceae bacterium]|nr:ParB/RepB/Spo0J family partition protein [Paracoccaceae bacterium]
MSGNPRDRRGLGRGLSALMADVALDAPEQASPRSPDRMVPVARIRPNPAQPRRDFDDEALADLTRSIREKGVLQPLIVRPDPTHEGEYQIVAGERRWRAAQRAQVHEVPVLLRDLDDTEALEVALIENIQRADLNAAEEAQAYAQLMERFGHTQEKLAAALGKSRSHIANTLRLVSLPDDVLALLRAGKLSAGHARALVPTENPSDLARQVVARGLSVRQTEHLAKRAGLSESLPAPERAPRPRPEKDADTRALEGDLSAAIGLPVSITHELVSGMGYVQIHYNDLETLDRICAVLSDPSSRIVPQG